MQGLAFVRCVNGLGQLHTYLGKAAGGESSSATLLQIK